MPVFCSWARRGPVWDAIDGSGPIGTVGTLTDGIKWCRLRDCAADIGTPRDGGATRDPARAAGGSGPNRGADLGLRPGPELVTDAINEQTAMHGMAHFLSHAATAQPTSRHLPPRNSSWRTAPAAITACSSSASRHGSSSVLCSHRS